jgi:hypothetical protein
VAHNTNSGRNRARLLLVFSDTPVSSWEKFTIDVVKKWCYLPVCAKLSG